MVEVSFIVPFEFLGLLNVTFIIVAMVVLYRFREKPQVKIRNLFLVEIQLMCGLVTMLSFMLLPIPTKHTCAINVVMLPALQGFLAAVLVRCLMLKLAFNVSCDSVQYMTAARVRIASIISNRSTRIGSSDNRELSVTEFSKSGSPNLVSDNDLYANKERLQRLQRNRFLFRRSSIVVIWLVISSMFWLYFFTQYFVTPSTRERIGNSVGDSCGVSANTYVPLLVSCFVCLIGVTVLLHGFQKIHENFKLKEELWRLVLSTVATFVALLVLESLARVQSYDSSRSVFHYFRMVYFLISIYSTYTTLGPVLSEFKFLKRRSSRRDRRSSKSSVVSMSGNKGYGTRVERFKQVLNHPEARRLFTKFLMKEFSSENIFFHDAVCQLKETLSNLNESNTKYAQEQVAKIMELFCVDNAPLCINLSYACRQNLIKKYDESKAKGLGDLDIFDDAFQEILGLMLKDSFPRFIRAYPIDRILDGEVILSEDDLELVRVVSNSV